MPLDPQSLIDSAKCYQCGGQLSFGEAMQIALLVQIAQGGALNPDAIYSLTNDLNNIHGRLIGAGDLAGDSFGAEYLSAWMGVLKTLGTPSILLSGDSTTAGTGITDPLYLLQNLLRRQILSVYPIVSITNSGVGGSTVQDWVNDPAQLAAQIAAAPDLWIIRQGLNRVGTPQDTLTWLETGLQTIRATLPLADSSILLMTPNVAYDPLHGRDLDYALAIDQGIRQLARTYNCAFLDLVPLFRDQLKSALLWMDAPYANQYAVHPLEIMNVRIVSRIMDMILPKGISDTVGSARLTNPKLNAEAFTSAELPTSYTFGWSMHRATLANGWPADGAVFTNHHVDGAYFQINSAYNSNAMFARTGQDSGWGAWQILGTLTENSILNQTFLAYAPLATTLPTTFTAGISLNRATLANGWPVDGAVMTIAAIAGIWMQFNFSYASSTLQWRTGQDNSWNAWIAGITQDVTISGTTLHFTNGALTSVT